MPKNILALTLLSLPLFVSLVGCGSSSDGCSGTTFVNQSTTESVTVAANSLSGVSFTTFTLAASGSNKVCGDDSKDILGDYTWSNGDTANKGMTCSSCDLCIFLTTSHTATTGSCP